MPIQIKPTVYETFTLDDIDRKYGVEGEATFVVIKQASQAQHADRQKLFSRMERKFSPDDDPDEVTIVQELSNDELKQMEVWLTLCDSNIEDENGNALFKSKKDGKGNPRLDMSRQAFVNAWGRLLPDVANAIHDKVLELNIMWDSSSGEEF